MTTTPTSGAADLPEALRLAAAISNLLCSNEAAARTLAAAADELVRLHAESEMRRAALLDEMQKAALAAGQATAAQAVVPSGWKLVPLDATDEMVRATDEVNFENGDTDGTIHNVWNVMIAAAPAQPAAQHGAAYAALPEKYYLAGGEVLTWDAKQMRAFADATHTLRASHGLAPAETGNSVSAQAASEEKSND